MAVIASRLGPAADRCAADHSLQQLALLRERIALVVDGGRDAHIRRHRERGKLLARERIDLACDDATAFLELSPLAAWGQYGNEVPAAGIVTGTASSPASPACSLPTTPP